MRLLPPELAAELSASQLPCGAFPSTMVEEGQAHPDVNGFVTAQVLRALGGATADPRLQTVLGRALDFLESCEDPRQAHAYRFWPERWRPSRLPVYPADADDTAVIAVELARHGRRDRDSLLRTVLQVLIRHRVPPGVRQPASWVRPGVFWTWLDPHFGYNLVDCTVNANVAGLMARLGLEHVPGYEDACGMIEEGLRMAEGRESLTRLLSPYYTHPVDLLDAVCHAVDAGSERLQESRSWLLERWGDVRPDEERPVFSSAYGRVTWFAPLLLRIRGWASGWSA